MADLADRRILDPLQPHPPADDFKARARGFLRAYRAWAQENTTRPLYLTDGEVEEVLAAFEEFGGKLPGVDWRIAFALSCVETANYTFGNQVPLTAHNPAGIGAVNDDVSYVVYPSWRRGILAMFVHLLAWLDRLELVGLLTSEHPADIDERVPIVEAVRAEKGAATTYRSLGGRWAVAKGIPWQDQATMTQPANYGMKIAARYLQIVAQSPVQAPQEGGPVEPIYVIAAAGHHNTSGGNPREHAQTGELVEALARGLNAYGGAFEVEVLQPDGPDPDTERGDGDLPGSLDLVGNTAVARARAGRVPRLVIECHTEGGGSTGAFGIYADWTGDLDVDVRDKLAPLMARKVAAETGLGVRRTTFPGAMSEKDTSVGASGSRLGFFRTTEPIKETTERIIFEFGANDKEPDRTIQQGPDFYDQCGRAAAAAIAEFYGVPALVDPDHTLAESELIRAYGASIPYAVRGELLWEGAADLTAFGGSTSEQLARYERLVAHRLAGSNFVLTLDLWDQLRREGKIRRWPGGERVSV